MASVTPKKKSSHAATKKKPENKTGNKGTQKTAPKQTAKPEGTKPPAYMQAKLAVSHPQDSAEKEADHVAKQVARAAKEAPATTAKTDDKKAQRASLEPAVTPEKKETMALKPVPSAQNIQRRAEPASATPEKLQKKEEHSNSPEKNQTTGIQREAADPAAGQQVSTETENRIEALRGGGSKLPTPVEEQMSTQFNSDFSGVRIHNDKEAAELCAETHAHAFTVGSDIFFAPGEFSPESDTGRELLAHELTHVIQQQGRFGAGGSGLQLSRSPLSDDLREVLRIQGKGALFERLRNLKSPAPDVLLMVESELSGDDLWLAHNLALYGQEPRWPLHLRVEREMKGWSDSGGKAVVFDILRAADGAEAGNIELALTLLRLFAGDDLWLAINLQRHGIEAKWPIHLRVAREMKGWSNSGGKAVVFDLLRAADGAEKGNIELAQTLLRLFAGDDLWLAINLQLHGVKEKWPILLRVEHEMKGWSDSGGKAVVFDLLRAADGAEKGNIELAQTLLRLFAGDDRWLAINLQLYGVKEKWPIHLQVEREMKGWSDCGGKEKVFEILRNDGAAHANNDKLIASLESIFVSGSEDATLAVLLRKYGTEASWPFPQKLYQCPFDIAPESSPGERILYNGEYSMVPGPDSHYHELRFTAANGTFDTPIGPAVRTFTTGNAANRIDTGNFSFFIPAVFAPGDIASVTMEFIQRSNNQALIPPTTWNFTARVTAPTTINQVEPDNAVPIGSVYHYDIGPALPPPAMPPFYEHQTVLEEFEPRTSNLQPKDMDPFWRISEGIYTKEALDAKLFSSSSNNGTFVIDAHDQIHDRHSGGQKVLDDASTHLFSPMQIDVDLPQTYTAGPGNVLGNYTIRRTRKANGSYELRKFQR